MGRPLIVWKPARVEIPEDARVKAKDAEAQTRPRLESFGINANVDLNDLEPHQRKAAADAVAEVFGLPEAANAILKAGIPSVDGAATPKEDAIGLLMLAAEVEHALMVQYLYTAQSISGRDARPITAVAVQEMGHLLTVHNLLLALEGVNREGKPKILHFGRDGLRNGGELNPMPLILEPVSQGALAKYVVVERPHHISDPELATRIAELEKLVDVDVNPVFALYAAITWIFQKSDAEPGSPLSTGLGFKPGWHLDESDFSDSEILEKFTANEMEWPSSQGLIVDRVLDQTDAQRALKRITEQGEGLPASDQNSHFAIFLAMLDKFEAGLIEASPMPRTPWTEGQSNPEDPQAVELTDPYTVFWARMFNCCYQLVLLDIAWALCHELGEQRRKLVSLTIDEMENVIGPVAAQLQTRPVATGGETKAGPTYAIDSEFMPTTSDEFHHRYSELLTRLDGLERAISKSPEFEDDWDGAANLDAIKFYKTKREPFLPLRRL